MVCMLLNMFEARPMNENKTQSGEKKEEVNLNNGYDSQFDHISEQKKIQQQQPKQRRINVNIIMRITMYTSS